MNLEIDDDRAFQKKIWFIERVFWIFFFLFVLLSIAGFLGKGPAASKSVSKNDIHIEYKKYLRVNDLTTIRIKLPPQGRPVIGLPKDYIDKIESISLVPAPEKTFYADNQIRFIFMVDATEFSEINVSFKPLRPGILEGFIENNNTIINFSQFVYP